MLDLVADPRGVTVFDWRGALFWRGAAVCRGALLVRGALVVRGAEFCLGAELRGAGALFMRAVAPLLERVGADRVVELRGARAPLLDLVVDGAVVVDRVVVRCDVVRGDVVRCDDVERVRSGVVVFGAGVVVCEAEERSCERVVDCTDRDSAGRAASLRVRSFTGRFRAASCRASCRVAVVVRRWLVCAVLLRAVPSCELER